MCKACHETEHSVSGCGAPGYFVAKKKDNLEEIYNAIAEELRGQYLLTYTPDRPDNDEEFHKVALKAKNADLTVVTREGYYSGEK